METLSALLAPLCQNDNLFKCINWKEMLVFSFKYHPYNKQKQVSIDSYNSFDTEQKQTHYLDQR